MFASLTAAQQALLLLAIITAVVFLSRRDKLREMLTTAAMACTK